MPILFHSLLLSYVYVGCIGSATSRAGHLRPVMTEDTCVGGGGGFIPGIPGWLAVMAHGGLGEVY